MIENEIKGPVAKGGIQGLDSGPMRAYVAGMCAETKAPYPGVAGTAREELKWAAADGGRFA